MLKPIWLEKKIQHKGFELMTPITCAQSRTAFNRIVAAMHKI